MLNAQADPNTIDKSIFLNMAWDMGCTLVKDAIWHDKTCNWQGYWMEPVDGKYQSVMRTFNADMYGGTSGIASFLNALYTETQDKILLRTLEGTIQHVRQTMHAVPTYGFYAGKAGIAATLIRTGNNLQREDWITEGLSLLESMPTQSIMPHETDVISGAASTIPVLLDAYLIYKKQWMLDKAIALGNLLCSNAVKNDDGWSWATVPSSRNLTGFSHGASGMALALLQLHHTTNEQTYLTGADAGFLYERNTFDATQNNWPDYRTDVNGSYACAMAWCHGAPGITIARAEAVKISSDPLLAKELEIALNSTTRSIYQSLNNQLNDTNFSLCHGIAGNADIILEYGEKSHHKLAEAIGVAGIQKYHQKQGSWPSGLNSNLQTPGLMMGTAGMGYFYLRLSDPEKHPTLLRPHLKG